MLNVEVHFYIFYDDAMAHCVQCTVLIYCDGFKQILLCSLTRHNANIGSREKITEHTHSHSAYVDFQ